MEASEIKQRFEKLVSLRQTVNETWDQIERFIAPYRGRFFKDETSENSIEWRRPQIFDSTAIMASQSLASHLHAGLTSPKVKWFELRFRDQELKDNREAKAWLDECTTICFQTLQDSNFTTQASETYQDLTDFGTSFLIEEPANTDPTSDKWKGIRFNSVPIKEGYFEQDDNGDVANFYRVYEWSAVQILSHFGEEQTPDWVKDKASDPEQAEQRHKLIQCVYRRWNINEDEINTLKPLAAKARPYGMKWVLHSDASEVGLEGGYYEMPAFVPRWRKTSSSMWGNSPSMVALSDVMTLNRLVELNIQAMEKVVDPAILTTERGLIGDLDLNPAGLSVVRSLDDIKTFESGARFDVTYQEMMRYRDQIREYYMIDQLMLPPMAGTPATATEIAARVSQLERLIAPTLGRLQADFLDPLINRTFRILLRAGRLPSPPESVEGISSIDIEYVGALARSQQQDQVSATDRWLMQLMNVAQMNPDVLDVPDWDAMMKGTAEMLGVPAKYAKPDAEIARVRKQREKMQQAAMEAEIAKTQGEAMEAQGKGEQAMTGR